MSVTTRREFVGPALATAWLKGQPDMSDLPFGCGRVSLRRVEELAGRMHSGEWDEEDEGTLKFADGGLLIDGHHRLAAIIASGRGFQMTVASGINWSMSVV